MISIGEDFKPALKYKPYLAISSVVVVVIIWALCCGWIVFIKAISVPPVVAVLVLYLLFVLIWTGIYYKSVVYHLNSAEITWKRDVWVRKTSIVPYNRITNVDIAQGHRSCASSASQI